VTTGTAALGHAATVALALGLVCAGYALLDARSGPLGRAMSSHAARLEDDLTYLRSPVRAVRVVEVQLASLLLLGAISLGTGSLTLLLGAAPAAMGPALVVRRARLLRAQKVEAQLDGWLLGLAHTLRVTPSLGEAMAATVATAPLPIRQEVQRALDEHALGAPLDEALRRLGRRSTSRAVEGAMLCLAIARNAGGPVSVTLEQAAAALREIARLEGLVRAKTAEGKAQAFVMTLVPAPLVLAIHWIHPGYFAPLTEGPKGCLVIAAAAALWGLAILLALRITAVEV
jgi:tight adherence protein B